MAVTLLAGVLRAEEYAREFGPRFAEARRKNARIRTDARCFCMTNVRRDALWVVVVAQTPKMDQASPVLATAREVVRSIYDAVGDSYVGLWLPLGVSEEVVRASFMRGGPPAVAAFAAFQHVRKEGR
jgi:hypothetical protein